MPDKMHPAHTPPTLRYGPRTEKCQYCKRTTKQYQVKHDVYQCSECDAYIEVPK